MVEEKQRDTKSLLSMGRESSKVMCVVRKWEPFGPDNS